MRLEEVKRMLPRCFYYHREFIGSTPVIWVFLLPAPPHRVNASCYTIDKALNDEYLIPKKFEALPIWRAHSFTYISLNSQAVSSHRVAPLSPQVI